MENKEVKVIVVTIDQLQELIDNSIQRALYRKKEKEVNDTSRYLTSRQASEFLNLARQTIYGLTCRKAIPYIKRGKKLYFVKAELQKWVEEGRNVSAPSKENLVFVKAVKKYRRH